MTSEGLLRWASIALLTASTSRAAEPGGAAPVERDFEVQLREAADHYQRAFELYDEGAFDAALTELKRAYELAPAYRLLYNLGVMSIDAHDYAGAVIYLERYLAEAQAPIPAEVREEIARTLRDLAQRVARVSVVVNLAGAEVSVDDRFVGKTPLQAPLLLNVGTRRISARADGRLPDSRSIDLAGGDERELQLNLIDPQANDAVARVEPPSRPIPWLGWGVSVVLAGGAVFSGLHAVAAQGDYEQLQKQLGITRSELDAADQRALHWSIAADTLAVAALATASYSLYLTLRPWHPEPTATATAAARWRVEFIGTGARFGAEF